jgi:hypothetical protein
LGRTLVEDLIPALGLTPDAIVRPN